MAFERAFVSKNLNDLIAAKKLRTVKRQLRNAKADFILSNLNNNADNPRKFWENINKLIKNKNVNKSLNLNDDDGYSGCKPYA